MFIPDHSRESTGTTQGCRENYCALWICKGWLPARCNNKNGHGPDGLYCRQHAKEIKDWEKQNER